MAGERQLPGLGLYGFWTLGSNGYKTQNDENLLKISALLQASAISFISFLPGAPTNGDIYILDATADIHKIAVRDNGAWTLLTPDAGWMVYVVSDGAHYVFDGTAWVTLETALGIGSVTTFLGLSDVPSSFTGEALKAVRVNAAETDLEFYTPASGVTAFIALSDVPAVYTGAALQSVRVNAAENALEFFTPGVSAQPFELMVAVSDETSPLTAGTAKVTFRMPRAVTLTAVKASVTTAPTGGTLLTVDINEGGVSILSTKLTFDASEKTTVTAATPAVISDTALAADAEITIDIDSVGSTIAGAGLKVTLIGTY
jgi:hypothetical protein